MKCSNEAEAKAAANKRNVEFSGTTWCPMTDKQCRVDCYCFSGAQMIKQEGGSYYVHSAGCGNPMLNNFYVSELIEKVGGK